MPEIEYAPNDEEWKIIMKDIPDGYQNIILNNEISTENGYYKYFPGLECDMHLRRTIYQPCCIDGKFHVKIAYNNEWKNKGFTNKEFEGIDAKEVNIFLRRFILGDNI